MTPEQDRDDLDGWLGFVVIPDMKTRQRALEVAKAEMPSDPIFRLDHDDGAHITLYHTHFANAPWQAMTDLADLLNARAYGMPLTFGPLSAYRGLYLFWDTTKTELLLQLHIAALSASVHLDHSRIAPLPANAADTDDAQTAYNARYGYPLCYELWQPHITLGAKNGLPNRRDAYSPWNGSVERVVLAKMGPYGRLLEIIPT